MYLQPRTDNIFVWDGLFIPTGKASSTGHAIKFQLQFPENYPACPRVVFVSLVDHPWIDSEGVLSIPVSIHDQIRAQKASVDLVLKLIVLLFDDIHAEDIRSDGERTSESCFFRGLTTAEGLFNQGELWTIVQETAVSSATPAPLLQNIRAKLPRI
jgi:hypothetical protein